MLQVDALECRMSEIKSDIFNSYKQTIKKVSESFSNDEEYNDHDYLDSSETPTQEINPTKSNLNLKKRNEAKKPVEIENKNEEIEVRGYILTRNHLSFSKTFFLMFNFGEFESYIFI